MIHIPHAVNKASDSTLMYMIKAETFQISNTLYYKRICHTHEVDDVIIYGHGKSYSEFFFIININIHMNTSKPFNDLGPKRS